jgi:hypothetical protein
MTHSASDLVTILTQINGFAPLLLVIGPGPVKAEEIMRLIVIRIAGRCTSGKGPQREPGLSPSAKLLVETNHEHLADRRKPVELSLNQNGDTDVTTHNFIVPTCSGGNNLLAWGLCPKSTASGRVQPAAGGTRAGRCLV